MSPTRRPLPSAAALALVLLASACDSSSGGGTTSTPSDQLYERWAASFCDILVACPVTNDDDSVVFALFASADKTACRSFMGRIFDSVDPARNVETAIAAGRVLYHADKLSTCLAAARSACTLDLDEVPACREVLEGTVAVGGTCSIGDECAGDAHCEQPDFDCPGSCVALSAAGGPCDWDGDCSQASGALACGTAGTCVALTVVEGAAAGAACGETMSETEVTDVRCAAGTACDYDWDSGVETCVRFATAGQACGDEESPDCAPGLFCQASGSGGSATCGTVPIVNTVGAACNESNPTEPYVACNLMKLLSCVEGKCKALGDGSLGSACATGLDVTGICNYGLYCDRETLLCQPQLAAGASCSSSSACLSGYCNGDDVCEALVCE